MDAQGVTISRRNADGTYDEPREVAASVCNFATNSLPPLTLVASRYILDACRKCPDAPSAFVVSTSEARIAPIRAELKPYATQAGRTRMTLFGRKVVFLWRTQARRYEGTAGNIAALLDITVSDAVREVLNTRMKPGWCEVKDFTQRIPEEPVCANVVHTFSEPIEFAVGPRVIHEDHIGYVPRTVRIWTEHHNPGSRWPYATMVDGVDLPTALSETDAARRHACTVEEVRQWFDDRGIPRPRFAQQDYRRHPWADELGPDSCAVIATLYRDKSWETVTRCEGLDLDPVCSVTEAEAREHHARCVAAVEKHHLEEHVLYLKTTTTKTTVALEKVREESAQLKQDLAARTKRCDALQQDLERERHNSALLENLLAEARKGETAELKRLRRDLEFSIDSSNALLEQREEQKQAAEYWKLHHEETERQLKAYHRLENRLRTGIQRGAFTLAAGIPLAAGAYCAAPGLSRLCHRIAVWQSHLSPEVTLALQSLALVAVTLLTVGLFALRGRRRGTTVTVKYRGGGTVKHTTDLGEFNRHLQRAGFKPAGLVHTEAVRVEFTNGDPTQPVIVGKREAK